MNVFVEAAFFWVFLIIKSLLEEKNKPVGPLKVNMDHHNRVYCTNKHVADYSPALPEGDAPF